MAETAYNLPESAGRLRRTALLAGLVVFAAATVLAFVAGGPVQFFRAYLVAFLFTTGLAVGSLAWLSLGHMTGGAWALVSRRIFEAATRTIPLMALLFIPIVVALFVHTHASAEHPHGESLYEWSNPALVKGDEALEHKSKYLNPVFFIVRGLIYFAVWSLFAYFLNKWSLEQDKSGDPRIRSKMQDVSGPVILIFGFTVTFAAIDWGMSLEPHWFSTIYGLLLMAGWGLSSLAFAITVAATLDRDERLQDVYQPPHFHDLGKLLLAMVMLYAYFGLSQFLITWSGNLPEEIPWYLRRMRGGWQYVGLALILFHFALPFVLLLSRTLKRHGPTLQRVAILMLVMRVVDLIYLIAPARHQAGEHTPVISALDFVTMAGATAGLFGVWLAFFLYQLAQRPLLPVGSPDLEKALAAGGGHH